VPLLHYVFCNVLVEPQVRGTEWLHVLYEDGDEEDMSLEVRGLSASSTTTSYVCARRLVTGVIASGKLRIVGNLRPNRMRACGDLQSSSAAISWLRPSRRIVCAAHSKVAGAQEARYYRREFLRWEAAGGEQSQ